MNLETLKPLETYKYSKERYDLLYDQILSLYANYRNKHKISILLEFWLWNIRLVHKLYGESGLKEFLKGEFLNPSRYAQLKETKHMNMCRHLQTLCHINRHMCNNFITTPPSYNIVKHSGRIIYGHLHFET